MALTRSLGIEQNLFYLASHYAGNTLDYKCVVVLAQVPDANDDTVLIAGALRTEIR